MSLETAKKLRDEIVWQKIDDIILDEEIDKWLMTLKPLTRKNYRSAMKKLARMNLIQPFSSLQAFSLVNQENIVDKIKLVEYVKEGTKQARAGAYISLTRYLGRKYKGIITKAEPKKEGNSKTFYKTSDKVTTSAMTQKQWLKFFECLDKINMRDALIARLCLQGAKRIQEVLSLEIPSIDWDKNEITFTQSKSETARATIVTFSPTIMGMLRDVVKDRSSGLIFHTSTGQRVGHTQVYRTFNRAGKEACLPLKVTPHVLRCSAITFLASQGFSCEEISKITGYSSLEMVKAHDKSHLADNPTKKINLI